MRNKKHQAQEAINDLFSDTDVSAERTKDALEELLADIENKIECLKVDVACKQVMQLALKEAEV